MKKTIAILIAAVFMLALFSGCSSSELATDEQSSSEGAETLASTDMFSDRDMDIGYSASDCETITLADSGSRSSSDSVIIDGNTLTITDEGYYIVSGSLSDGQLIVDADESYKVQIILNGASITNSDSAAIYIKQADKVFLTTAKNSDNSLSAIGDYLAVDDNNIDAAIFSKEDLTLNGAGSLTINAKYGHAVVSKDDLILTSGTYTITAASSALSGKNSVRVAGGSYSITAEKDGIHSENNDDSTQGFIYIAGGDFTISAGSDGMDAITNLTVVGGTINIKAADDGMHADAKTSISGGTINITESYEGIEGLSIEISGGTINLISSDDGINAAGLNDKSSFSGPEKDSFAINSDCYILISGGSLTINAMGDGIDSNGDLKISGGYTTVSGPTDNGNGTLDYAEQGSAVISGGTLLGAGSSGMPVTFSDASTQCSIFYAFTNSVSAGTEVALKDFAGNVILSFKPEKTFQSVNLSSPEITSGNSYTLCVGDAEYSIEMTGSSFSYGASMGMGGGGQFGGGMRRADKQTQQGTAPAGQSMQGCKDQFANLTPPSGQMQLGGSEDAYTSLNPQ